MDSLRLTPFAVFVFMFFPGMNNPACSQGKQRLFLARYLQGSVEFDGVVDDWREAGYPSLSLEDEFVSYGKEQWHGKEDASVRAYFAYDEGYLYIAFSAEDDKHVRTRKFTLEEDHVEIRVSFESVSRLQDIVIAYFPGRRFPTFKGGVRFVNEEKKKTLPVKGVKLFEYSKKGVWESEIVIPWKSLPQVWRMLPATKWSVSFLDCDNYHQRQIQSIVSVASFPVEVEPLGQIGSSILKDVLKKGLGALKFYYADVAMDDRVEVIMHSGGVFGIFGHGFMDANGYVYVNLPVESADDIDMFKIEDVTGDGRKDLIFDYMQKGKDWKRKIFAIYCFRGEEVVRVFAQETFRQVGNAHGSTNVEIIPCRTRGKKKRKIVVLKVTGGSFYGWDKDNYTPSGQMDVDDLIAPWEQERVRYYIFRAGGFERIEKEVAEVLISGFKRKGKK